MKSKDNRITITIGFFIGFFTPFPVKQEVTSQVIKAVKISHISSEYV